MTYKEIPKMLNPVCYRVDISWGCLIDRYFSTHHLNLNPTYQRGHVWTEKQKIEFIEFCLKGGTSARNIHLNHPGWMGSFEGPFEVVDGKQRISAVKEFVEGKLKVLGNCTYESLEIRDTCSDLNISFSVNIARIKDPKILMQWYLEMNSGGTVHTEEELDRVRHLIQK